MSGRSDQSDPTRCGRSTYARLAWQPTGNVEAADSGDQGTTALE